MKFITVIFPFQEIHVPFHLSALDSTGGQLHDENLIKEFRFDQLLENNEYIPTSAVNFTLSLKTLDAQKRFIEKLIQNKKILPGNVRESLELLSKVSKKLIN